MPPKRTVPEEYKESYSTITDMLQNDIGVLKSEWSQITKWMFDVCVANEVAPDEFQAYIKWYVSDVPLSFTTVRGGGKQSFVAFLGPYRNGRIGSNQPGVNYLQRSDLRNLTLSLTDNPAQNYTCVDFPWAVEYFVIRWLEIIGNGYQPTGIEMVRNCGKVAPSVMADLLPGTFGLTPCRTRKEFDRRCQLFFAVVLTDEFSWALGTTPAETGMIWRSMDTIGRRMFAATQSEFVEEV